ncbi:hypothetical protein [Methanococcoides burtonii]|uniref:hypothetical protein n=1 Tax=Methanococcoides burtonii TaxID=29291 RepID=UPI0012F6D4BA
MRSILLCGLQGSGKTTSIGKIGIIWVKGGGNWQLLLPVKVMLGLTRMPFLSKGIYTRVIC